MKGYIAGIMTGIMTWLLADDGGKYICAIRHRWQYYAWDTVKAQDHGKPYRRKCCRCGRKERWSQRTGPDWLEVGEDETKNEA